MAQQQLTVVGALGGNVSPMFDRPRSLSPHPYGTHPGSHPGQHPELGGPFGLGAAPLYPGAPPFHGGVDFARSPTRGRAYTMQGAIHHGSAAHLTTSPNHLTVAVPGPLGELILFSWTSFLVIQN